MIIGHNLSTKENWAMEWTANKQNIICCPLKKAQRILGMSMKWNGDKFDIGLLWKNDSIIRLEEKSDIQM